ncbi:MAG: hypothetical protein KKH61_14035 [Gammaproteobacteria bacterium]|nr:hypothetical protein [Gammaproteobacteria bacterium]
MAITILAGRDDVSGNAVIGRIRRVLSALPIGHSSGQQKTPVPKHRGLSFTTRRRAA